MRALVIWAALAAAIALPIAAAATSPLLAWREPVYIIAGFAGILAMGLMLVQPLLALGMLPGLSLKTARRVHLGTGLALILSVLVHVGGLWITSPPDVIDALLLVSPTPFSIWGVVAMWGLFATALIAALRRRNRIRWRVWRRWHLGLALVIVTTTILHAVLIEGTMENVTKLGLSLLLLLAALWMLLAQRRASGR